MRMKEVFYERFHCDLCHVKRNETVKFIKLKRYSILILWIIRMEALWQPIFIQLISVINSSLLINYQVYFYLSTAYLFIRILAAQVSPMVSNIQLYLDFFLLLRMLQFQKNLNYDFCQEPFHGFCNHNPVPETYYLILSFHNYSDFPSIF